MATALQIGDAGRPWTNFGAKIVAAGRPWTNFGAKIIAATTTTTTTKTGKTFRADISNFTLEKGKKMNLLFCAVAVLPQFFCCPLLSNFISKRGLKYRKK
jgi:hypothetical protein